MPLFLEWGEEMDTLLWMCSKIYIYIYIHIFDVIIIVIIIFIKNTFVVVMV